MAAHKKSHFRKNGNDPIEGTTLGVLNRNHRLAEAIGVESGAPWGCTKIELLSCTTIGGIKEWAQVDAGRG